MAQRWKATLPKEAPPDGQLEVVLAFKTSKGGRVELTGRFNQEVVMEAYRRLMRSMHADRNQLRKDGI